MFSSAVQSTKRRSMSCLCKQKTAYEMRISDWSSDVCSSDLTSDLDEGPIIEQQVQRVDHAYKPDDLVNIGRDTETVEIGRASCRTECVSTCRSGWSPYH